MWLGLKEPGGYTLRRQIAEVDTSFYNQNPLKSKETKLYNQTQPKAKETHHLASTILQTLGKLKQNILL